MAKKDYLDTNITYPKKNALSIFFKYKGFMKKKGHRPVTRVKNPEPNIEIQIGSSGQLGLIGSLLKKSKKKTGYKESDVIKIMRRS